MASHILVHIWGRRTGKQEIINASFIGRAFASGNSPPATRLYLTTEGRAVMLADYIDVDDTLSTIMTRLAGNGDEGDELPNAERNSSDRK